MAPRLPREEDRSGTHHDRRWLIDKQTGDRRAVKILLGHTKLERTARYLCVDTKDALSLSEATEV